MALYLGQYEVISVTTGSSGLQANEVLFCLVVSNYIHSLLKQTTSSRTTHLNDPPLPRVNLFPMPPPRAPRKERPPREGPRLDPGTCAGNNMHQSASWLGTIQG